MKESFARILADRFFLRPIFQVGASRSGTIVLYQALGKHRNIISMPSENPLVTYLSAVVVPFEFRDDAWYFKESVKVSERYLYARLRDLLFETAAGSQLGFRTLAKEFLKNPADFPSKRFWCVKCFPLERDAHALTVLYPASKFIYIVRNGVDVVASRTKFPAFRDQAFHQHCEFWVQAVEKFDYLRSWDRCVEVRQEELVADPETAFDRIFSHLGVQKDQKPVNFVRTTLVHSRGDKSTRVNVDVRRSLTERVPSYQTWDNAKRETFKRICGPSMDQLGYEIPF